MSDNDNVIEFKPKTTENVDVYFGDTTGDPIIDLDISNAECDACNYLAMCKKTLEDEDYRDVLCGIIDTEIYNELDKQLQDIVDIYYLCHGSDHVR